MDFKALTHMASEAHALAPECSFIVFGSTSAFGTYPDLATEVEMYGSTLDADFVPEPLTDDVYQRLSAELGKGGPFYNQHGYYADINGPRAFNNFPAGFRDRLVPLHGVERVFALDPNDMAVAKLIAGRPKDIQLLSILLAKDCIDEAVVRTRLWFMERDDKFVVKTDLALKATVAAARDLGYTRQCPEQPWKTSDNA